MIDIIRSHNMCTTTWHKKNSVLTYILIPCEIWLQTYKTSSIKKKINNNNNNKTIKKNSKKISYWQHGSSKILFQHYRNLCGSEKSFLYKVHSFSYSLSFRVHIYIAWILLKCRFEFALLKNLTHTYDNIG